MSRIAASWIYGPAELARPLVAKLIGRWLFVARLIVARPALARVFAGLVLLAIATQQPGCGVSGMGAAVALAAGPPSIQFDVQPLVECRDVTTPEFRAVNPGERLIEARLSVSVLAPPDSRLELGELLVRCENPDRTAFVVDFAPRTALATDVSGSVKVQKEEEENRSLDYHFKANYPGVADADLQGSNKSRMHSSTNFERLPPRELCVASGTINRGCGVYYKWKPTSQTTLEGARDLTLVFRVASGWRADWLAVHCEAYGRDTTISNGLGDGQRSVRRSFVVALHEAGDVEARQAAIEVLRAEAELRRALVSQRREVQKTFQPQPLKDFSQFFRGRPDATDADRWWNQVAYGPS
ncbi:MAG TPA: hypothetical protein PLV92_11450, partial [Pirellulaceae bacterium]|nr:hypothetical protein [Pirellulaceae bacterium]